jgi:hypothetical protein
MSNFGLVINHELWLFCNVVIARIAHPLAKFHVFEINFRASLNISFLDPTY